MLNKALFEFTLSKCLNTSVLVTSLYIYNTRTYRLQDKTLLLLLGILLGFLSSAVVLFATTTILEYATIQLFLSCFITFFTAIIGYNMVAYDGQKRSKQLVLRFALILLPAFYILNQGLDIDRYIQQQEETLGDVSMMLLVFTLNMIISTLFGTVYYLAVTNSHLPCRVQKCVYSAIMCFMGAIELSKVFGYIEQRSVPQTALVYLLRQQQQQLDSLLSMKKALPFFITTATDTTSTGYSVYWVAITFFLFYKHI